MDDELTAVCRDIAARQRYRAGPRRVADAVNELLARRGYADVQSAASHADIWRAAAGSPLGEHSAAGKIRRGVLEVFARNSAIVQELTFRRKQLLADLARLGPDRKIRDLKFRVGPVD